MATFYQTDQGETTELNQYAHVLEKHCRSALSEFRSILNSYFLFHFSFLFLLLAELLFLTFSLITSSIGITFAITLATTTLTFFSYMIISYYFQGRKPHQFSEIKKKFFTATLKSLPFEINDPEKHFAIANGAFQLSTYLTQKEVYTFTLPPFQFIEDFMLRISFALHAKDILYMQELLLKQALQEHNELIKLEATDLAVHTSLANTFITLSKIYETPKDQNLNTFYFVKRVYERKSIEKKLKEAIKYAIEELKIVDELAPSDPWTYAQLANCYHRLEIFEEEVKAYEALLHLRPQDKEILYRLGLLYFKLGQNAKGLKTYETLKMIDALDASHLISHYNAYIAL